MDKRVQNLKFNSKHFLDDFLSFLNTRVLDTSTLAWDYISVLAEDVIHHNSDRKIVTAKHSFICSLYTDQESEVIHKYGFLQ